MNLGIAEVHPERCAKVPDWHAWLILNASRFVSPYNHFPFVLIR
jgi:hypothetical protein